MKLEYFLRNKKYKFETYKDYSYHTDYLGDLEIISDYIIVRDGYISAKAGYSWDGSSIPGKRFIRFVTFGMYDGDRYCKKASLVHDCQYQLMRLKLLSRDHKEAIDRLYEKMCIEGAKKIIEASYLVDYEKIIVSDFSFRVKSRKWNKRYKEKDRLLKRLPAWAARRYWAIKTFGARTLSPRYRPEKVILET